MTYWLNLFTVETWQEFKDAGGNITGFREARWSRVQKVQPHDIMLCYLVGAYRWIGALEVTGEAFFDASEDSRIWSKDQFPARLPVRIISELTPETGVPVTDMLTVLEITSRMENLKHWGMQFRGSPARWSEADGEVVMAAIGAAATNPVSRPLGLAPARQASELLDSADGPVVLPTEDESEHAAEAGSEHTHLQHLLVRMGLAMGYTAFVPASDRRRQWDSATIEELPGVIDDLTVPLVKSALRVIREIDVIWLDGDSVTAAFEVERTTSIYSGLLRMSDLLALQPNLSIDCFLVAPDEKRQRVYEQVNRATFARMRRPLASVCRYIPFSALLAEEARGDVAWKHQRYSYVIDEMSESLELDEL